MRPKTFKLDLRECGCHVVGVADTVELRTGNGSTVIMGREQASRVGSAMVNKAEWAPQVLHTWKVQTTMAGAVLTINGQSFELGASAHPLAFDLERAAAGWNPPAVDTTAECERPNSCRLTTGRVNESMCRPCSARVAEYERQHQAEA